MESYKKYNIREIQTIIHSFLNYDEKKINLKNKNKAFDVILKDLKEDKNIGFAGYLRKKYLKQKLIRDFASADGSITKTPKKEYNETQIIKTIKNTIKKSKKELPSSKIQIFLFPSFNQYVEKIEQGVCGYCPYKNTFFLQISPGKLNKKRIKQLIETIVHEYNHVIYYKKNYTQQNFLSGAIMEGLAEYFNIHITKGKKHSIYSVYTEQQTKYFFKVFKKQKTLLSPNFEMLRPKGKYPLSLLYCVGYRIVHHFLKNNPNLNWRQIMKLTPQQILKKSKFEEYIN